jgi:hypothetical protein
MKIITSGLTRDINKEFGELNGSEAFALYYNKSIYRFIYEIKSSADVARFINDFEKMKFENCDTEETDGGENYSIEYFFCSDEQKSVKGSDFIGDGLTEIESIEYDYNWLHSITLMDNNETIICTCGSFSAFNVSPEGKQILDLLKMVV